MHGKGLYHWNDGRSYNGEYNMNKKEGKGIYTYGDGKVYDG